MRAITLLLGLLWLTLTLVRPAPGATPDPAQAAPPAQDPDTPPSVSNGETLWRENCEPCHGPTGHGDGPTAQSLPGPPPNFADPAFARQLAPAANVDVIKNGRIEKLMPPWGERLSDAQIWDTAAFVWRLSTTPEALAAGEEIYGERCSACHGEGGTGDGPEATAEMLDFTDAPAMVQRSQADLQAGFSDGETHADLTGLPEADLWATLDYIRTFSFATPRRNGLLHGRVINATTGEPLGDIEVILRLFDGETEVESFTTQADSAGRYTFEQLITQHGLQYVVEGRYQDVLYRSQQPAIFTPDSHEATLDLPVYETTTSAEAIHLARVNHLVVFDAEVVQIVQVFVLSNNGQMTYIGQDGTTFYFPLPPAAENVAFENDGGGRFIEQAGGYADTEPIAPGEDSHFIVVTYNLPYEGNSLAVEIPMAGDVASVNVLMQDVGAELNSDQLRLVETRAGHGDKFSIFSAGELEQGETLRFELTNLDSLDLANGFNTPVMTGTPAVDQNFLRWLIIGMGGAAIIGAALVYPALPQRSVETAAAPGDAAARRQKLLLTLARLDQMFATGDLDETVYRRARARYKTELAALMRE